jgi:hypothetical protein
MTSGHPILSESSGFAGGLQNAFFTPNASQFAFQLRNFGKGTVSERAVRVWAAPLVGVPGLFLAEKRATIGASSAKQNWGNE